MAVELSLSRKYLSELPKYLRHEDFIDGDVESVRKYLVRHQSEYLTLPSKTPGAEPLNIGQKLWSIRNERLANDNFTETVMETWLASLSQEVPIAGIDRAGDPWNAILENMTGLGDSKIEAFTRQVMEHYCAYGLVGVLTEGPADVAQNAGASRAERSFSTIYPAKTILSYSYFTDMGPHRGKLREIWLFEDLVDASDKAEKYPLWRVRRFWLDVTAAVAVYKSQLYISEKGVDIFDKIDGTTNYVEDEHLKPIKFTDETPEISGGFDFIPFAIIGRGIQDSVLRGVVSKNREHLNKKSSKDQIDYYQAFQRTVFFGVEPSEVEYLSESLSGFVADSGGHVDVIEAGDPQSLTTDMENLKRDAILQGTLKHNSLNQLASKELPSADSKRMDNITFEDKLNTICDLIQSALTTILRTHARFELGATKQDFSDIKVDINRDFNISTSENELSEAVVLYRQLDDFGDAGFEAKKELTVAKLAEAKLLADSSDSEQELKQKLIDGIRKASREAQTQVDQLLRGNRPQRTSVTQLANAQEANTGRDTQTAA